MTGIRGQLSSNNFQSFQRFRRRSLGAFSRSLCGSPLSPFCVPKVFILSNVFRTVLSEPFGGISVAPLGLFGVLFCVPKVFNLSRAGSVVFSKLSRRFSMARWGCKCPILTNPRTMTLHKRQSRASCGPKTQENTSSARYVILTMPKNEL